MFVKESKKAVLKYMLERKKILFGKFDDTLTKEKKSAGCINLHLVWDTTKKNGST
jgi:hypothetical protein